MVGNIVVSAMALLKKDVSMNRVIVIIGPTAVGKTDISIALAKKLNSEIISGDSMLIYKGFDIGTAKPDSKEQDGIKHHLLDILDENSSFSVTDFKDLAGGCIAEINKQGKIPIVAGGTGLYAKSLLENYNFNKTSANEEYRLSLEKIVQEQGKEFLHKMLQEVDPITSKRLHINDVRRVIRALEVFHQGGEYISQDNDLTHKDELAYDAVVIGLNMDRAKLYARINQRVDIMINNGLVEEVKGLLQKGVQKDCQAMQAIGYKEIVWYLEGSCSLEYAIEKIKQSTRHFAKRQLTWFRKMSYIQWYNVDELDKDDLVGKIYKEIALKFRL